MMEETSFAGIVHFHDSQEPSTSAPPARVPQNMACAHIGIRTTFHGREAWLKNRQCRALSRPAPPAFLQTPAAIKASGAVRTEK
ncbi:hypothetical protein D9M72_526950 [compost metagenome]